MSATNARLDPVVLGAFIARCCCIIFDFRMLLGGQLRHCLKPSRAGGVGHVSPSQGPAESFFVVNCHGKV
jgi:hypothetical protein